MYTIEEAIGRIRAEDIPTPIKRPLPTDTLIAEYEANFGIKFPDDYKKVLKQISNAFVGTLSLLFLDEKHERKIGELGDAIERCASINVPVDWLPICEDNSNFFCLMPNGNVRFWDHHGRSDEVWETLADWIREVWLAEE